MRDEGMRSKAVAVTDLLTHLGPLDCSGGQNMCLALDHDEANT